MAMAQEQDNIPSLTRQEAEEFITQILMEKMPERDVISAKWINRLIKAFHSKVPYQNITLLSCKGSSTRVPLWEDIRKDVIWEGKGGLCHSLNFSLLAVLRALGVRAYSIPANYVATGYRGVHLVTVFHLCKNGDVCCKTRAHTRKRPKRHCSSGVGENSQKNELLEIKSLPINSLYLGDVGCGYPTLRAVSLSEDLNRVLIDCGLEYQFIRKGRHYLRLHRAGDEVPAGEEMYVGEDGWRPVFSFTLTPRPFEHFLHTMRSIYINRQISPYFSELHAVRYITELPTTSLSSSGNLQEENSTLCEMVAVKNDYIIELVAKGRKVHTDNSNVEQTSDDEQDDNNCKRELHRNRKQLNKAKLIIVLTNRFSMIPNYEIEKALDHYFSTKNESS